MNHHQAGLEKTAALAASCKSSSSVPLESVTHKTSGWVNKAVGKTCSAEQKGVLETLEKGGLVEHLSLEQIERTEQAVEPRHSRRFREREAAIKADVDEEEIGEAGDVVWLQPDYEAASRQRR